jgi:hypothetical protein
MPFLASKKGRNLHILLSFDFVGAAMNNSDDGFDNPNSVLVSAGKNVL